jgi:hypothetical protein
VGARRAQLVTAILTIATGSVIEPRIVAVLVAAQPRVAASPLTELTPSEVEIQRDRPGIEQQCDRRVARAHEAGGQKHIDSIFLKLGLSDAEDVSKRVKAALLFLAEESHAPAASEPLENT